MKNEFNVDMYFNHWDIDDSTSKYKIRLDHVSSSDTYSMWFENESGKRMDSITFSDGSLSGLIDLLIELEHQYGYEKYQKIGENK